jgi:hypothetical protein
MIRRCDDNDLDVILPVINYAAQAYKGVIPADRWKEPYMSKEHLRHEMDAGVVFWGYEEKGEMLGVMGIQDVQDVTLLRHAYCPHVAQESWHRREAQCSSQDADHTADARRHLGRDVLDDPILRKERVRAGHPGRGGMGAYFLQMLRFF